MNTPELLQEEKDRKLRQVPAASRAPFVACLDAIRDAHSTVHKQAMGSSEPLNSYSISHHKVESAFQELLYTSSWFQRLRVTAES